MITFFSFFFLPDMSATEEDVVMSSGSSDEQDSDIDDEVDDAKTKEEIDKLKSELRSDPFLYDKYIELIKLLSQAGELDDLREVREAFAKHYPLSPELWLSWLADEQRLASSPEEKVKVSQLFEKATQDYNSVKVWYEYCQFSLWQMQDLTNGVQSIRKIFERAVVAAGVNAAHGTLIWETYRVFENSLLSILPEQSSQDQLSKVDRLFKRQLAVPLLGMEQTLAEYQEWLSQTNQSLDPNVQRTFKMALELLKPRQSLEDKLEQIQEEGDKSKLYQVYEDYIALELKEGNPVRVQNIYERRITDHCLEPVVWTEYVSYLETSLKDHQGAKDVLKRATRNCPWNGRIWIKLLRSCERLKCPAEEIVQVVEDALQSGLASSEDYRNVWLAFIDYRRRQLKDEDGDEEECERIRQLFQRALEQLASMAGDPDCQVARYWASLEADHFSCMDRARRIWGEILSGPVGDQGRFWLEYITLEKMFGDTKHLKKLLPRAFLKAVDSPQLIGDVWLQFEREEGTLESYENVEEIVLKKWSVLQKQQEEEKKASTEEVNRKSSRKRKNDELNGKHEASPAFKKPMLPSPKQKPNKAKEDVGKGTPGTSKLQPPTEVKAEQVIPPPGFKDDQQVMPPPGFKSDQQVMPPPGFKDDQPVKPPPGFKKATESSTKERLEAGQNTVFLSNLDFSVTEEKIKEVMSLTGEVLDIRLVKNYSGKSKGFAYVQFATSQAVQAVLLRDNEALDGRPMFISEYDTEKKNKGHTFKYSNDMEKNKLFVKNLPQSATKEVVAKLFSAYGNLKDIRIVTYRNGHSKGIAYVDFEKAADAAKAILQLDNKDIDGSTISVAISNPPPRKEPKANVMARSLGAGDSIMGSRGRGRTQLSFVPRSLQKQKDVKPESSEKMSNSDFRSMLLGGKK